ncbi:MAG: hypothetical protein F6J93_30725 [Oscillatoria sp. SIO1A7]|nr:hypothetical protein [Oscillatoria sp. SIO1A7]
MGFLWEKFKLVLIAIRAIAQRLERFAEDVFALACILARTSLPFLILQRLALFCTRSRCLADGAEAGAIVAAFSGWPQRAS